ncbi:C6 zinc finger domain-containing protein [Fusarium mexicanum]|uniref:C6 zinc finger domain-containing protein n=1 Tax=Fusarium mexicanum TaxID=751941 RepID=A0A8H5MJ14_9HYPO|nr:C6 zinc finger domain-containing protein [Fusarium mexicanum]
MPVARGNPGATVLDQNAGTVSCMASIAPTDHQQYLQISHDTLFRAYEVVPRLANIEARLSSLESRSTASPVSTTSASLIPERDNGPLSIARLPDLHTAASHKMLDGWPRLRLHIHPLEARPLALYQAVDASDPLLTRTWGETQRLQEMPLKDILQTINQLHQRIQELPLVFTYLFTCWPEFSSDATVAPLQHLESSLLPSPQKLSLHRLSIHQLLLLSMGLRLLGPSQLTELSETSSLCEISFALCLERLWVLHANVDLDSLSLILTIALCLVHLWGRPFHSLGLLQSLDSHFERLILQNAGSESIMHKLHACAIIHYVLESDILTELDGIPSRTAKMLGKYWPSTLNSSIDLHATAGPTDSQRILSLMKRHKELRSYLNHITQDLYLPEKANATPHELAQPIQNYSARLRQWYENLDCENQFARDVMTLNLRGQKLPIHLRELALRYYTCIFLLNRPVLYFYLHEELEYNIRPLDPATVNSNNGLWVHESCKNCIEAATLIIHVHKMDAELSTTTEKAFVSWCDIQMLFAVYMVVLQLKTASPQRRGFKDAGEIESLLDTVMHVMERAPFTSANIERSLVIMKQERQGFSSAM